MALRLENVGDGRLEKMEVDYSATVDQKIPLCEQMTKVTLNAMILSRFILVLDYTRFLGLDLNQ